jgi:hypothetical protein
VSQISCWKSRAGLENRNWKSSVSPHRSTLGPCGRKAGISPQLLTNPRSIVHLWWMNEKTRYPAWHRSQGMSLRKQRWRPHRFQVLETMCTQLFLLSWVRHNEYPHLRNEETKSHLSNLPQLLDTFRVRAVSNVLWPQSSLLGQRTAPKTVPWRWEPLSCCDPHPTTEWLGAAARTE